MIHLDEQASVNTIRALVGTGAGFREKEVLDAADARVHQANDYPGCVEIRSKSLRKSIVVRMSDGRIVN